MKELYDQLGVRVPVYALFTKADLIAGFTEFFDDLDRERRGQVWGMTFPLNKSEAGTAGLFGGEFQLLVERLNQRLLDRLQAERSPDRRTLIAGFPAQVASLAAPLGEFLTEAFGGSRLDPAPLLRGAYLTSGTQEGTPIDRLTGAMARSFGIDAAARAVAAAGAGAQLLPQPAAEGGDLRRGDAGRARSRAGAPQPACPRRRRGGRAAGRARRRGRADPDAAGEPGRGGAIQTRRSPPTSRPAQSLPLDPVAGCRSAAHRAAARPGARPAVRRRCRHRRRSQWFPGLSQTGKLGAGAREVYRHALQHILLPRLIVRLEGQMRAHFEQPAFLYEATRVYLMLGSAGPLDRDLVKEWMSLDWQAALAGSGSDSRCATAWSAISPRCSTSRWRRCRWTAR